jgi:multidrug transporter EmrE-like cation transporter
MVQHVGDNAKQFTTEYGNVSAASIGAIQRGLLQIEEQGGDSFFGEPMLDIADLMQTDENGRGVINILAADKLLNAPRLYSTFLLWLLAELFEQLLEAGDLDKPKLVFFFDEAHLLFNEAPPALLEKIEQVVRLIRSKGVGVYFVTQNPLDVPETVLGQLGNRVQHALRAFTPRDQKAVKTAAKPCAQPEDRHRGGHHRTGRGRGAGLLPRREGPARHRRARLHPAAGLADRATAARREDGGDQDLAALWPLREGGRPRVGLREAARLGSARFAALAMLVSTAATGGHFLATQPAAALVQPWPVYALGAAMGLFSTVVPVFALSAAIRRIGSGRAALLGMVGPLLTIVFAWLLLDEGFSTAQMAGVVLVVAGVATVSRR